MIRMLLTAARRFLQREDGAAGAEIAIWVAVLAPIIFSIVDLANFTFKKMQVNEAAQAAAQRAWLHCNTAAKLPLNVCTGVSGAMTTAAQATGLGAAVTVSSTTDAYYCANGSGALVQVGNPGNLSTAPTKPSTCTSVTTGSTAAPGEYVLVTTTYTFTPAFGGISFSALLPTTVTRTAWVRLV